MLTFVTGTAGTGKSRCITDTIIELAKKGEKCLLLVPEQFSKTGETLLFSALDETGRNNVELFSFSSLMRDVNTNHTPIAATPLSAAGKAVIARRAVNNTVKSLDLYSKQSGNFGFSFRLADTFDNLKRSGIGRDLFYNLAEKAPEKSIKLRELALIYAEYDKLLGDDFADSEDLYMELGRVLPEEYTKNTHIFIDGFESFSYGQLKVIEKMMTSAKNVTVALTCSNLQNNGDWEYDDIFAFVKSTAMQLKRIAGSNGVKTGPTVVMGENHRFLTQDLKNIDLFLLGETTARQGDGNAFVTEFANQFGEVSYVAATINKLVQEGYTYNDIAVVCPQLDKYENQLQESFTLAAIPYFIDSNRIISSSAPVVLFKTIMAVMAEGVNAQNIIPLLKTGLTYFDREDISQLENYLYVWQDYKFDLSKPFEFSPAGLKTEIEEEELELLEKLNGIRSRLWDLFAPVKNTKEMQSGTLLENCYNIAIALGADIKMQDITERLESESDRQLLIRQWEAAINCLDELFNICRGDVISADDMETLFMLMVDAVTIGFAPQTQDCVMITDPKRMKLEQVKAVFIIGAAQDIFPAAVSESGLISASDRQYLKESNHPLKNDFDNLYSFEKLYYYKALTSASEKLFISSCKKNIDTKQSQSSSISTLARALNLPSFLPELEDYRITKEFFTDYAASLADNITRPGYINLLNKINIAVPSFSEKLYDISDLSLIDRAIGNSMTISPTGAQSYFQCAFMYFLQRILDVKPLEKAEFSAKLAGTYLHYVVQKVMAKYKEDFYMAQWEDIAADIDENLNNFIKENYPRQIADEVKFTAQYENMTANATRFLRYIHREQGQSMFRPVAYEEKIGLGGDVPPLTIEADGKKVNIVGVADRVDIYRGKENDYLRIVDYKTGSQKFSLDEVYNGLSSQLLLYMNALLSADFAKGDKPIKAGAVVYQPADAAFKFDKDNEALYTAVGMALANPEISAAFDNTKGGKYGVIAGDDKLKAGPGSVIVGDKKFEIILDYVKDEIKHMAQGVWSGKFSRTPLDTGNERLPCTYCRFKAVCANPPVVRTMEKNTFDKMEKEDE